MAALDDVAAALLPPELGGPPPKAVAAAARRLLAGMSDTPKTGLAIGLVAIEVAALARYARPIGKLSPNAARSS